jgi:hypothetical protein
MTFSNMPGPIDGALTSSALLRKGLFAAIKGEGVAAGDDLLVYASSPNGQSLKIGPGVGVVLNGYQTTPDEVYVATNPAEHSVTSGDMPGSSGGTTYWMVCIVVGDPQSGYSQTGHPFMPSDFDEDQANTYQYVRPVLLPCSVGDTKFDDLGKSYPGLALARLALPPSTVVVSDAMLTDLRVQASDGATRRWDKICSGNVVLTNAQAATDITGMSQVVAVTSPNDVFDVDFNGDVTISGTVTSFLDLLIGGTDQGAPATAQGSGHNSIHGSWTITGLTAGNHTFKMSGSNLAGSSGTATVSTGTSKMRIRRVD